MNGKRLGCLQQFGLSRRPNNGVLLQLVEQVLACAPSLEPFPEIEFLVGAVLRHCSPVSKYPPIKITKAPYPWVNHARYKGDSHREFHQPYMCFLGDTEWLIATDGRRIHACHWQGPPMEGYVTIGPFGNAVRHHTGPLDFPAAVLESVSPIPSIDKTYAITLGDFTPTGEHTCKYFYNQTVYDSWAVLDAFALGSMVAGPLEGEVPLKLWSPDGDRFALLGVERV